MPKSDFTIATLGPDDLLLMDQLLDVFSDAFESPEHYSAARPAPGYMQKLLASGTFIALAAVEAGAVIGGLTAYELRKFEQARSEIYIYDLAVMEAARRNGVATALIEALRPIAAARGAHVIFVQADLGDDPAIALYTKLGKREDVLHFDIAVN
jgi:aminoglycoside 3-N-acetyltransferase I